MTDSPPPARLRNARIQLSSVNSIQMVLYYHDRWVVYGRDKVYQFSDWGTAREFHYHALDAAYLVAIGETEPSSLQEVHPEDYGGVLLRREEWRFTVE